MEEEEDFDPNDPEMVPVAIEDIESCLAVVNENFKAQTGREFPKWRSSQPAHSFEVREFPLLGVRVPIGSLFYPCSGKDAEGAIEFFRGYVSDFHFSDPFNPLSEKLGRGTRSNYADIIKISHVSNVLSADGGSHKFEHFGASVVSHKKDGVLTLLDDLPAISVFYYRGDSGGEGGAVNTGWGQCFLI